MEYFFMPKDIRVHPVVLWLKKPPNVNENSDQSSHPWKNFPPKTVLFIAFRIALTPDVKIVWFGCQKTLSVTKRHTKTIIGCSKFQKFTLAVFCFISGFVY